MQIEITFDNTPIIYEEDYIKYINPTRYDPSTSNKKYATKYNPPTEYTTKNNPTPNMLLLRNILQLHNMHQKIPRILRKISLLQNKLLLPNIQLKIPSIH